MKIKDRHGVIKEYPQSFSLDDLQKLADFVKNGPPHYTMFEIAMGAEGTAIRHDVDHSLAYAAKFAKWEFEQGIRSTYFVLPTAFYWTEKVSLRLNLSAIASYRHEIGVHNNSLTQAFEIAPEAGIREQLARAADFLAASIRELTDFYGIAVRGVAAHASEVGLNNLGVWDEWDLRDFGLKYEAYHLNEGCNYISDNRGQLRAPLEHVEGQPARLLVHPEHWELPS